MATFITTVITISWLLLVSIVYYDSNPNKKDIIKLKQKPSTTEIIAKE